MSYVCILCIFVKVKDLRLQTFSFTFLPLKLHNVLASDAISAVEFLVCVSAGARTLPLVHLTTITTLAGHTSLSGISRLTLSGRRYISDMI